MSQPTFGTVISTSASGSGIASITIASVVVSSGQALMTFVGGYMNGVATQVSGVARNGQAQSSQYAVGDTVFNCSYCYFDASPTVGTFNTVVSFGTNQQDAAAHSIPISGLTGVTGVQTNASAGGTTTPSVGTFAPTANDIVLAHLASDTAAGATPTGTGSQVDQIVNIGTDVSSQISKDVTGSGTITMAWSQGGTDVCAMGGVILQGTPSGPSITAQPQNVLAFLALVAAFSVSATSSGGSLTYQWKKNGSSITGATSATLNFNVENPNDNLATFACDVTDSNGTITSTAATLFIGDQSRQMAPIQMRY